MSVLNPNSNCAGLITNCGVFSRFGEGTTVGGFFSRCVFWATLWNGREQWISHPREAQASSTDPGGPAGSWRLNPRLGGRLLNRWFSRSGQADVAVGAGGVDWKLLLR